jgi:DNA polymerase-3 subunit epsilon
MHRYIVIDFETTGLIPGSDRIIEVAALKVENHRVVDTYTTLMNPGFPIPGFITDLTGITHAMVKDKPRPEQVMPQLRRFIGNHPCVAHNASFDRRFFAAEMSRTGIRCAPDFVCSLLIARRLIRDSHNHQLGTLVNHLNLPTPDGMQAHRALADTLMTQALWQHLMQRIQACLPGQVPDVAFLTQLSKVPKAKVDGWLRRQSHQR